MPSRVAVSDSQNYRHQHDRLIEEAGRMAGMAAPELLASISPRCQWLVVPPPLVQRG
jgi:hypothetical protein